MRMPRHQEEESLHRAAMGGRPVETSFDTRRCLPGGATHTPLSGPPVCRCELIRLTRHHAARQGALVLVWKFCSIRELS